jgi:hypothetical protein
MIAMKSLVVITESEQDIQASYATCTMLPVTDASVMRDRFATSPMFAIQPISQPANEEELHTSFEQAIGERIQTMHQVSQKTISSRKLPMHYMQKYQSFLACLGKAWQRLRWGITLTCLALLLMMAGFDLMALLVLYTR